MFRVCLEAVEVVVLVLKVGVVLGQFFLAIIVVVAGRRGGRIVEVDGVLVDGLCRFGRLCGLLSRCRRFSGALWPGSALRLSLNRVILCALLVGGSLLL